MNEMYQIRDRGGARAGSFDPRAVGPAAVAHPGAAGPSFLGHPLAERFGAAARGLPDHDELHVWLRRHDASGMCAPRIPTVNCS